MQSSVGKNPMMWLAVGFVVASVIVVLIIIILVITGVFGVPSHTHSGSDILALQAKDAALKMKKTMAKPKSHHPTVTARFRWRAIPTKNAAVAAP